MDNRKSERSAVPMKQGHQPEGTLPREGNAGGSEPREGNAPRTQGRDHACTGLPRIAELARGNAELVFTGLARFIDIAHLREAHARTRKDGATGVDGQTAEDYARDLESNLVSLRERLMSGSYRAPPVRGVEIPKGNGKTRPIGIPTFEDKVLQRAIVMVVESIYEQDFKSCSYGFRPGRSAHGALEAIWQETMAMGGCWVIEVDIKSFFDTLDHGHLRAFLDRRVGDGVVRRMIDKWLKAGVMTAGGVQTRTEGTPQGGVISPLLANIYLHEVLDVWFERDVRPRIPGQAKLIRYADDFVILLSDAEAARKVMEVLPKRFEKYGLTLHPEKTRLIDFRRPRQEDEEDEGGPHAARTFDLLGFTHYWGRTRHGRWAVTRKTMRSRFTRTLRAIATWCRANLHLRVAEQHKVLSAKLIGHDAYYGITGNSRALSALRCVVERIWRSWLDRRSRHAAVTWACFASIKRRYPLPPPRIVHSVYSRPAKPNL